MRDSGGKVFIHDHSPFASDCNENCGWYEVGKQVSYFDVVTRKQIHVKD